MAVSFTFNLNLESHSLKVTNDASNWLIEIGSTFEKKIFWLSLGNNYNSPKCSVIKPSKIKRHHIRQDS